MDAGFRGRPGIHSGRLRPLLRRLVVLIRSLVVFISAATAEAYTPAPLERRLRTRGDSGMRTGDDPWRTPPLLTASDSLAPSMSMTSTMGNVAARAGRARS